MANAEQLIQENLRNKNPILDLGNCGLDGTEAELELLAECTHLQTLIFSNEWWEYDEEKQEYMEKESINTGNKNNLIQLPVYFPKNLLKIILAGEYYDKWEVKNISSLRNLENLQSLDLRYNQIKNIEVLQELKDLQQLYLRYNQIQDISTLAFLYNLRVLFLGSNQICDISSLKRLDKLENLDLRYSQIQDYSFLQDLKGLQTLDLRYNIIANISFLSNLSHLQTLFLSENQVQSALVIKNLKNLKLLFLTSNQVQDISFLENLYDLEEVYLWNNQIRDISPLKNLKKLKILDLKFNQIQDISPLKDSKELQVLALRFNQIQDISPLKNLKKLQNLDLRTNQVQEILVLQDLDKLKILDLYENQIHDISPLKNLTQLQELYLSENQIHDIFVIQELKELEALYLSKNQIKQLPLILFSTLFKLEELYLYGNPIQNIPKEIFDKEYGNVFTEVKDYLLSVQEEAKELNEAKLVIAGVGEVGKSEITDALSLADYTFNPTRASTLGIRIKHWEFPAQRANTEITFRTNIWDLAGQKENYNTHQFFLSKNTLYLFVSDVRKGEAQSKFDYWLNIISLLSENAPIFIVQNKIDIYQQEINRKDWKEKFENIADFFQTSCKTGQGIEVLKEAIKSKILELPNTQELWNKDRFKVREILEQHEEEYIELKEYLKICTKHNLTKEQAFFLSQQLHDLGIILHFSKEPLLKNTVVLNAKWAVDAAYCLVDTKKVKEGRFQVQDLEQIWSDERFEYKHSFLLELMKKFELVFQFQESDTYIVPESLPISPPTNAENIKAPFGGLGADALLRFEYHYEFMPEGILSRLTCRLHHYIKEDWFWRYGIILEYDKETKAEIMLNDVSKQLKIKIAGKNADKLLAVIRSNINYIHDTLKNPPLEEKIPCVCEECIDSTKPYLHNYQTLLRFQKKGKTTRECAKSALDVSIQALLEGILDTSTGNISELIDLIERNDIADFYDKLGSLGVSGNEISRLRKQFVYDGGDFQYADKLKVWVQDYFGKQK